MLPGPGEWRGAFRLNAARRLPSGLPIAAPQYWAGASFAVRPRRTRFPRAGRTRPARLVGAAVHGATPTNAASGNEPVRRCGDGAAGHDRRHGAGDRSGAHEPCGAAGGRQDADEHPAQWQAIGVGAVGWAVLATKRYFGHCRSSRRLLMGDGAACGREPHGPRSYLRPARIGLPVLTCGNSVVRRPAARVW